MNCEGITGLIGQYPYREPIFCKREAEHECAYCGEPVCIRCTDPCFECGEHLHDHCRDDHAKEAKHQIDYVKLSVSNLDVFVDRVLKIAGRA